jgi:hypothetical protein
VGNFLNRKGEKLGKPVSPFEYLGNYMLGLRTAEHDSELNSRWPIEDG